MPGDDASPGLFDAMDFYKTTKWKKLRSAVLRRDGYLCAMCKRYGRATEATTVHHIKHADEYPELIYDPKNLMSLCEGCHNKMHPEKGGSRKY